MDLKINDCYHYENHTITITQVKIPYTFGVRKIKYNGKHNKLWHESALKLFSFFKNNVCSGLFEELEKLFVIETLESFSTEDLERELRKRVVDNI
jgi:hypothetical protein